VKVPESTAIAARARSESAEEQRNRALKAIFSGRPLDAEPSRARKIHRFQAVSGVSTEQATRLADYDSAALSGLAGERLLGAERIQGNSIDFIGVSFLDLARAAAGTVGRVVFRDRKSVV